jgi:hypothetical protein
MPITIAHRLRSAGCTILALFALSAPPAHGELLRVGKAVP